MYLRRFSKISIICLSVKVEGKIVIFPKDLEVLDHKIHSVLHQQLILRNYRILSYRIKNHLGYLLFHRQVNFQTAFLFDKKMHKFKGYLHLIFWCPVQYKTKDSHLASSPVKLHSINAICFNLHLDILKPWGKVLPNNLGTLIHGNLTLNSTANQDSCKAKCILSQNDKYPCPLTPL